MGGGGPTMGTTTSTQTTKAEIPEELKPLYSASASGIMQMQNMLPLWGGTTAYEPTAPYTGPSAAGYAYGATPQAPAYQTMQMPQTTYPSYTTPQAQQTPVSSPTTPVGYYDPNYTGQATRTSLTGQQVPYQSDPRFAKTSAPSQGVPVYFLNGAYYTQDANGNFTPYTGEMGQVWAAGGEGWGTPYTAPTGQPTGTTPTPTTGTQDMYGYATPNFLAPHPQEIAQLDPLQMWGMQQIPGAAQTPEQELTAYQYAQQAPGIAGQVPSFSPIDFSPVQFSPVTSFQPVNYTPVSSQAVEGQTALTPEQYYQITSSPGYQATQQAYEMGVAPTIENQMALAGLGRSSSLADSLALGWSQMAPSAIESEYGRMERSIDRELALAQWNEAQRLQAEQLNAAQALQAGQWNVGTQLTADQWNAMQALQSGQWNVAQQMAADQWNQQMATGLEERAITREADMMGQMVPQLANLGGMQTTRELQAINAALQAGEMARGVEQSYYDAQYQDYLRRQALAEQALFGPMGMFPSTIGQSSTGTSTGPVSGGGGGMFK